MEHRRNVALDAKLRWLQQLAVTVEMMYARKRRAGPRKSNVPQPCFLAERAFQKEEWFIRNFRMTRELWFKYVLAPLSVGVHQSRNHQYRKEVRILRWTMWICGRSSRYLYDFHQDDTTLMRDLKAITRVAIDVLLPRWLRPLSRANGEYDEHLGKNAFTGFNAALVGDGVHVQIGHTGLKEFYNKKHKMDALVWIVLVDSTGYIRNVSGPVHGRLNDKTHWVTSEIHSETAAYVPRNFPADTVDVTRCNSLLRPGEYVLWDGIMKGADVARYVLISNAARRKGERPAAVLSLTEKTEDRKFHAARVIVEHVFGVMKRLFPHLQRWRGNRFVLPCVFLICVCFTNMHHQFMSAIRDYTCGNGLCPYCLYFHPTREVIPQDERNAREIWEAVLADLSGA